MSFKKFKFICFLIIIFNFITLDINAASKNEEELKPLEYYNNLISYNILLNNEQSIDDYFKNNKGKPFLIGCTSKAITASTILLFSLDSKNEYLFKNKNLEITIGELLNNRKSYLEKLVAPTTLQKYKLKFINDLLSFTNKEIIDAKVYKILNHTSVFGNDYNKYFFYFAIKSFIFYLPEYFREKLTFLLIQEVSTIFNNRDKTIPTSLYSSMGYMYIIGIMDLMTEENDFYQEIENRIFKPLKLENNFTGLDKLNKKDLKRLFPHNNFSRAGYPKNKTKILLVNIYDMEYTKIDTGNGALISDVESIYIISNELFNMFLGIDNKISNNKKIPYLFFKYKGDMEEKHYYSLGTYITFNNNKNHPNDGNPCNGFLINTKGLLFGSSIVIAREVCLNNNINSYDYFLNNKNNFKIQKYTNFIEIANKNILISDLITFTPIAESKDNLEFNAILIKSFLDLYPTNFTELVKDINNNSPALTKQLKKAAAKNIDNYFKDERRINLYKNHIDEYIHIFNSFFE